MKRSLRRILADEQFTGKTGLSVSIDLFVRLWYNNSVKRNGMWYMRNTRAPNDLPFTTSDCYPE